MFANRFDYIITAARNQYLVCNLFIFGQPYYILPKILWKIFLTPLWGQIDFARYSDYNDRI